MSFSIGAVTLPRIPEKIQYKKACEIKSYMYPGALPLLISFGGKADVLIVEGKLQEAGVTKATLLAGDITDLAALVNTEVIIDYDDRPYDGDSFIFVNFTYDERPGWRTALYVRMEFWKGSEHMEL